MDSKTNGEVANSEENGTTENGDVCGWIFRFFNDGWLKKGWKKRWCVLKDDAMVLYERQTTSSKDKNCGSIELKNYGKCVHATKKECKKSPHGLVLELPKQEENKNKESQKSKTPSKKVNREILYTATEAERDRWLGKLNEAISIARMGGSKNLEHVTKSRAKPPAVKRRPPTRKHLRDVATQSQLLPGIDLEEFAKPEPTKRGRAPQSAIKPPPGGRKRPTSVPLDAMGEDLEDEETAEDVESDMSPSRDTTEAVQAERPVPTPRHKVNDNEKSAVKEETSSTKTALNPPRKPLIALPNTSPRSQPDKSPLTTPVKSPVPPQAPSKALKPKLVPSEETEETLRVETSFYAPEEDEEDEENTEEDEEDDRSLTSSPVVPEVSKLKLDPGDSLPARSTRSLDRRDFDHGKIRSAPSSFVVKPASASDARTILLKAQALQANLKLPEPGEKFSVKRRGKSQSMVLLDQIDDDLPPPPEPPPVDYVSDVEVKADPHLKKKKQKKDKKKLSTSKSVDTAIDA